VPALDDEFLDSLLHGAGDSFAVPSSGPSAILRRVHHDDNERADLGRSAIGAIGAIGAGAVGEAGESGTASPLPAPRTLRRTADRTVRAHKVLTVAAAVLVLLLAAAGALTFAHGTPKTTAGLRAAPGTHTPATHSSGSRFGVTHGLTGSGQATESTPSAGLSAGSTAGSAAAAPTVPSASGTTSKSSDATSGANLQNGVVGQPARIEQIGSLDLTVPRGTLSATVERLNALATANGGFVANSQTHSGASGGVPSGTVTIEVPVADFSAALRQAQSLGKVSQLTTTATDVTAQYVDLQSRITALEASRQQYLTIMTKASSIGDVLAVQAQLDSLQQQIEQLQGQLTVLSSETDYSKMTTDVSEAGEPHHHHQAAVAHSGLAKAWHASVHGFVAGAEGLIRIAGPALFALLCLGAVLLGGQIFWRRLQRRNL
jgi:hypothetical protein